MIKLSTPTCQMRCKV